VISFIIPAYNEERLLGSTLRAVYAAAATVGEPYEVIVVDDASSDRTSSFRSRTGKLLQRAMQAHTRLVETFSSSSTPTRGSTTSL